MRLGGTCHGARWASPSMPLVTREVTASRLQEDGNDHSKIRIDDWNEERPLNGPGTCRDYGRDEAWPGKNGR